MKKLLLVPVLAVALLGLLAAPAWACARTIYVHPSGGDDTANIQAAFNAAVAAGPGSTVRLSAGRFYANNIVVAGFKGTFKGAGQGRTFIDTLRGLNENNPGIDVPIAADGGVLAPVPMFFAFDGGNVRVCDLSFDITAPDPAVESYYYGAPQNNVDTIVLVTGSASSAFDRVGFVAHPSAAGFTADGWPYNVNQCITIAGRVPAFDSDGNYGLPTTPVGGVDTVSSCTMRNVSHGVVATVFDGTLIVGGSPSTGNRFVNEGQNAFTIVTGGASTVFSYNVVDDSAVPDDSTLQCGVVSFQPDNSTGFTPWPRHLVIAHNTMLGCWEGVVAWQTDDGSGGPAWPLRLLIADNSITTTHSQDEGMLLEDDSLAPGGGGGKTLDAMATGNHIVLNDTIGGGIDGCFVNDAMVLGNRISGTGLAGIFVGTPASGDTAPNSDSGWKIIGNNVSGVTADGSYYGVTSAPIWLGTGATHCLVVGGKATTQVLDQGTDDTLINVTKLPLPATASASPMGQTKRMLMKGDLP